jgi:hypothetical protein
LYFKEKQSSGTFCFIIVDNNKEDIFYYRQKAENDLCHVYDAVLIANNTAYFGLWVIVELIAFQGDSISVVDG